MYWACVLHDIGCALFYKLIFLMLKYLIELFLDNFKWSFRKRRDYWCQLENIAQVSWWQWLTRVEAYWLSNLHWHAYLSIEKRSNKQKCYSRRGVELWLLWQGTEWMSSALGSHHLKQRNAQSFQRIVMWINKILMAKHKSQR